MKLIPFFLVSILCLSTKAGPIIVGNGGGLTELQFVFVWKNLKSMIETCSFVPQCGLTDETGSQLLKSLQNPQKELQFQSAQKMPEHFVFDSDGKALIFGTAPEPGSAIYINTDLLYARFPEGLNLPQIIGSLASAIGYQSGLSLKESMAAGQVLSSFWSKDFHSFSLPDDLLQQIQLNVLNQAEAEILLFDSRKAAVLTPLLKQRVEEIFNTGPVALKSFSSVYWNSENLGPQTVVTLNARVLFQTEEGKTIEGWTAITFKVSPQDGGLIKKETLEIEFMDLKAE